MYTLQHKFGQYSTRYLTPRAPASCECWRSRLAITLSIRPSRFISKQSKLLRFCPLKSVLLQQYFQHNMLEHVLQFLHKYFREYDVAEPKDLFDAFKAAITDTPTKNSIHDIMNSWTTQTGYPIVYVTVQDNTMYLRQERFLMKGPSSSDKSIWHVPITWTPLNDLNFTDTTPRYWLKDAQSSIKVPGANETFLILNIQQAGKRTTDF